MKHLHYFKAIPFLSKPPIPAVFLYLALEVWQSFCRVSLCSEGQLRVKGSLEGQQELVILQKMDNMLNSAFCVSVRASASVISLPQHFKSVTSNYLMNCGCGFMYS